MKLTAYLLSFTSLMNILCFGQDTGMDGEKQYPSPTRFEEALRRFETADREQPPPRGAIVCIGSSSIRGWDTIQSDLAPLTIIPRGFGGSTMNDALYYADRIVLSYHPRAIILYEGGNDITMGIAPEKIAERFRDFVSRIHEELPDSRIYFLSIRPSIRHWSLWSKTMEANSLIAAECAKNKRLVFVNVSSGMLNDEGTPRKEIFKQDDHMNRKGYLIWRNALRPILLKAELQSEPQKAAEDGR